MKKTKLFFAVACGAVVMSLSSCSKDYTCTCTYGSGNSYKETFVGVTKSQAKANCVTTRDEDGDVTTCKLD